MGRIIDGNDMNIVGDNVRFFRKQKNMSQQLLSTRLETLGIYICRGSISRIEDKTRTVTDIELYGFSKIFNISIDEFFITHEPINN